MSSNPALELSTTPAEEAGLRRVTGAVEIRKRRPSETGQSGLIGPAWLSGELERPARRSRVAEAGEWQEAG